MTERNQAMFSDDTIAAISTAPGAGAIAIVRLSGPYAFEIVCKIFSSELPTTFDQVGSGKVAAQFVGQSHLARHGYIFDAEAQTVLDEVVLIPYKGPRTYTGEDLVEINCHGGWLVSREILALTLKMGARLARPGEFTQRAYLSGRLDLTQAEAVLDLIQAKTKTQGQFALSALSGVLGRQIKEVRGELVTLLTEIVAGIDFPEEVGDAPMTKIESVILPAQAKLADLASTARSGRFLREGLKVAIVGRPNAGKSSLLNQLLRFERAIVTEIPGTTRDSLEELLDLNGIPVVLIDTAGIRPTSDPVEKIGIQRTVQAASQADLVFFISDITAGWGPPEDEILEIISPRPFIFLENKIDLNSCAHGPVKGLLPGEVKRVKLSATTGAGVADLKSAVEEFVNQGRSRTQCASLNDRQAELCLAAAQALHLMEQTLANGLPQDCLATDLKSAVDALSELCGEAVSEEVIQAVFANFCIGK